MRTEAEQLKDLHLMEKKRKPAFTPEDYWKGVSVVAGGRYGYAEGIAMKNRVRGIWQDNPKPLQVLFGGDQSDVFSLSNVRKATFGEYCGNPNGFGKTGWAAFFLSIGLAMWGFGTALQEQDWTFLLFLLAPTGIVGGTYANYKGWVK